MAGYATTAEERIVQERRADIGRALGHLLDGDPSTALETLLQAVEYQARLAGCGTVTLPR